MDIKNDKREKEIDIEELYRKMCEIPGYPCPTCEIRFKENPMECRQMCLRWKDWFSDFWQQVKANVAEMKNKGEL